VKLQGRIQFEGVWEQMLTRIFEARIQEITGNEDYCIIRNLVIFIPSNNITAIIQGKARETYEGRRNLTKVNLALRHEDVWRSGDIGLILDLGTR
jgi:hypothetical protein